MCRPARDRIVELWCLSRVLDTRAGTQWQSFYPSPSPLPASARRRPSTFPRAAAPRRAAGAAPPRCGLPSFIGRTGVLSEAVRAHPTLGFGNENGFGALILVGASVLFIVS